MAAIFSQQFTLNPGSSQYWPFGFAATMQRVGLEVSQESRSGYRYRGYLSTFVTTAGGGIQIFPELSLSPVWVPSAIYVLPRAILMSSLLFRYSRRNPSSMTFRMFVDDALN